MRKIYFVTGEPSGDLLASSLMKALHKKDPNLQFLGIGGESMQAIGFKSLFDISDLAVMGIFDVVARLPLLLRRLKQVTDDIEQQQPDVIVTVDSWGFASDLLKRLRKRKINIPRVHYVAPQVWAWKKGRAKSIARLTDCLLTLLPFEPPYFEKYGLKTVFVGHPVIENTQNLLVDKHAFLERYQIPENRLLISILPGSRKGEVSRLLPVLQQAALIIQKQHPNLHLLIPSVHTVAHFVDQSMEKLGIPYTMIRGVQERYQAFSLSSVALAASGTVSLELAACGTPHLITYSMSTITNYIVKYVIRVKFANLINIIADREIIPELMMDLCNAKSLAEMAEILMSNQEIRTQQLVDTQEILTHLHHPNQLPSEHAAQLVLQYIKQ